MLKKILKEIEKECDACKGIAKMGYSKDYEDGAIDMAETIKDIILRISNEQKSKS